jgi:hypothetical protein
LVTEAFELFTGEPAVLANIVAERRAANLLVYVRGEVAIVSCVVIADLWFLGHIPQYDPVIVPKVAEVRRSATT